VPRFCDCNWSTAGYAILGHTREKSLSELVLVIGDDAELGFLLRAAASRTWPSCLPGKYLSKKTPKSAESNFE
jgi:hypothetical protein